MVTMLLAFAIPLAIFVGLAQLHFHYYGRWKWHGDPGDETRLRRWDGSAFEYSGPVEAEDLSERW